MTKLFAYLAYLIFLTSSLHAQENNWNRFRGPNGSGVVSDNAFSMPFNAKQPVWRTETSGVGNSSPVTFQDRLFITSADTDSGSVFCIALT